MGRQPRKYPIGKLVLEIKTRKTGTETVHSVSLQYSWGGETARRTTGIRCTQEQWNKTSQVLRASYGKDYQHDNTLMRDMRSKYDKLVRDYVDNSGRPLTLEILRDILQDKPVSRPDRGRDFVEFAIERLKSEYDLKKIKYSRYKNGLSSLKQFRDFLRDTNCGTYAKDSIYVSELTPDLIAKLIRWRRDIKFNCDATINHALTPILKAADRAAAYGLIKPEINAALQEMRIVERPDIDDGEKEFDGKYLNQTQLEALVAAYSTIKEVRRKEYIEMFLFAFHACGMRVVDLMTLQWGHVDFDKREIRKIQVKTAKRHTIPLTDHAVTILKKWESKDLKNRFVFGLLTDDFNLSDQEALNKRKNSVTQAINQSLIPLGQSIGLPFHLTMHVARHTFAVLALNSGTNMSVVSRLLGHGSTDVTEKVYAQFLPSTLASALARLNLDYLPKDLY